MQHLQSALHVLVLDHLGQDILLEGAGEVVLQQLVVIDRIDVLALLTLKDLVVRCSGWPTDEPAASQ